MQPPSCPRPTYGRVLGSELVGSLVIVPITLLGALVGGIVAGATRRGISPINAKPVSEAEKQAARERIAVGAAVGAGAGLLASFYPFLAVQRAVLRNPECPNPSLGKIFVANLAKGAAVTAATLGGRAVNETAGRVVNAAAFFATVPIAQAILKDVGPAERLASMQR